MKLTRSLLLGTAAGFAAVAGAQAADLPTRKAAPVEYVRICSLGGGAFVGYVIPGSDVCLRVSGFVRWQYTWNTPNSSTLFVPGAGGGSFGTRGYTQRFSGQTATASVILDARTQTEFGLVRTFADMRIDQGYQQSGAYIDKAWIQVGGFQAGKYTSYYDFYADAFNNIGQLGSDHSAIGAAYTAIFGNFSAAVSLEDPSTSYGRPNYFGYGGYPGYGPSFVAGGYRVPDVVGRVLYGDTWGQVQLSGVVHQVRAQTLGLGVDAVQSDDTKYGWAVQGGVKLNVPAFGAGDALYLQAAYTEGAMQYVGATGVYGYGRSTELTFAADAVPVGDAASIKLTKGWNALAAFSHSFTPTISTAVWGSYTAIDYSGGSITRTTIVGPDGLVGLPGRDFHYWQVGAQANWSPIRNLTFSGTVNYINLNAKRLAYDNAVLPDGTVGFKRSTDGVGVALRVERDF